MRTIEDRAVTGDDQARSACQVFAFALALGVLLHELQFGRSPLSWHGIVVVTAVLLLVRPGSVPRLMLLFGAVGIELVTDLPNPWNHTMFLGIVGVAAVVHWGVVGPLAGARPRLEEVHEQLAPLLRSGFVFIWLAAAFAKLNSAFVESPESCAIWLVESVPGVSVPDSLGPGVIWGTIAVELAVPVLLLARRTRLAGVALGWGFHLVAALAGHTAFSGIAWAMYLLFLDESAVSAVRDKARGWVQRSLGAGLTRRVGVWVTENGRVLEVALLVVVAGHLLVIQELPQWTNGYVRRYLPTLIYVLWAFGWAAALISVTRKRGLDQIARPVRFRTASPALLAGLLLLVANAAAPYVGAKTLSSFTMYSDLRTEPGTWNHHVLPEAVRVLDWQDDVVTVLETDERRLAELLGATDGPVTVPALGVRVLVDDFADATVVYEHAGQRRLADPLRDDPLLGAEPSAAQDAVGAMRTFGSERRCQV